MMSRIRPQCGRVGASTLTQQGQSLLDEVAIEPYMSSADQEASSVLKGPVECRKVSRRKLGNRRRLSCTRRHRAG
jgi:hypothetical protein